MGKCIWISRPLPVGKDVSEGRTGIIPLNDFRGLLLHSLGLFLYGFFLFFLKNYVFEG